MSSPTVIYPPPGDDITGTAYKASAYKGPTGPLRHRCPLCRATGSQLLRCAGCHAFRYCSREHQIVDRPQHKFACNRIKKARRKLAKEDHRVRYATPDYMTPANAFETHVGRFWGLLNTRDYMRARFALAKQLLMLCTLDGVQEALEHLWDMLRLCRNDNMGLRNFVPTVMLRLDLDQECYDFMKWWATCDPDGHYDWGDMSLPFLNIHDADVLEVDVRNLKVTREVLAQSPLPFELRDQIERDVIRSPLSAKFQRESPETLLQIERRLLGHIIRGIGPAVVEANANFMFYLFDPDEALSFGPVSYSRGSWEEMAFAMQNSYATWWEMEGVLDLLNDARTCASRDSESEIEDRMQDEKIRKGRTAAEMLSDLSVERIWAYLDYAVENASNLGPWSERPSEQHTRENNEAWARATAEEAEDQDAILKAIALIEEEG
ncbi:hypothetical protein ONZ43_g3522 [Nemania bipapillata]|uniref:Uncharacterized protein n=1 Tax=Nemania bipapillata TaxID=110536 RepID=A0ACC2IWX5_9PEZI|nr:hypothetical protein ONZ43_g3522 [Nemania bipapillata]